MRKCAGRVSGRVRIGVRHADAFIHHDAGSIVHADATVVRDTHGLRHLRGSGRDAGCLPVLRDAHADVVAGCGDANADRGNHRYPLPGADVSDLHRGVGARWAVSALRHAVADTDPDTHLCADRHALLQRVALPAVPDDSALLQCVQVRPVRDAAAL